MRAGDCQTPGQSLVPTDFRLQTATDVMHALCICGCIHRAEQLEMTAGYFFAMGRAHNALDDDDCETGVWWVKVANSFAYRFCLNREAWRLFCDEMCVCAEHVVDGAPGDWIVDLADINMPGIAPNDEEMAEQMRDLLGHEMEASDVATAEKQSADWRALYRGLVGR